tara:strand:+ start:330 stop:515 length:186 start_codon:yes stop_codon:yes gene_type:complete
MSLGVKLTDDDGETGNTGRPTWTRLSVLSSTTGNPHSGSNLGLSISLGKVTGNNTREPLLQ